MRKIVLYFIALVLIAATAAAIVGAAKSSKNHDDKSSDASSASTPKQTQPVKKACDILTLSDAKQLLGDSAKGGENGTSTSSEDLTVSTCSYTQDAGSNAPVSTSKSAALRLRTPKSDTGIASNQNQFSQLKPAEAEDVQGYGDNAYWDAEHGQLNILKNNTWYTLSYGPITPADRTLDQTKQLADQLVNKL